MTIINPSAAEIKPINQLFLFWILPPRSKANFEMIIDGVWTSVYYAENKRDFATGAGYSVDASVGYVPRCVLLD